MTAGVLDFMRAIWRVNHSLERVSKRMEETLGVTAQQRMVIRYVGEHSGISAGQLAELLHVDAGTVSAAASRLERKGLLSRRRDDADRRRVILGLTRAGQALDRPTAGTVESAVERLLEKVSRKDVRASDRVLAALCEALDVEAVRAAGARANRRPRRRT